jgi:hypothetical protein
MLNHYYDVDDSFRVDVNNPFDFEKLIRNQNINKPLLLYSRRKSCCCTHCKIKNDPRGLKLVLENELIGTKL